LKENKLLLFVKYLSQTIYPVFCVIPPNNHY